MKKYLAALFIVSLLFSQCKKDNAGTTQELLKGEWTIKCQRDSLPGSPSGYFDFSRSLHNKMNFSIDSVYCGQIVTPTWIFEPYRGVTGYNLVGDLIKMGDSILVGGSYEYITLPKTFKIISITSSLMVLQHIYPSGVSPDMFTIDSLIR